MVSYYGRKITRNNAISQAMITFFRGLFLSFTLDINSSIDVLSAVTKVMKHVIRAITTTKNDANWILSMTSYMYPTVQEYSIKNK